MFLDEEEEMITPPVLLRYVRRDNCYSINGEWLWSQLYNQDYNNLVIESFFSRYGSPDVYLCDPEVIGGILDLRMIFSVFVTRARANSIKRTRRHISDMNLTHVESHVCSFLHSM